MSTATPVGISIWFPSSGLTVHRSASWHASDTFVAKRGQRLVVTPEIRKANTDTLGRCVFDLSAEEQQQRFGKVLFLVGEPPEDFDNLDPQSVDFDDARTAALKAAHSLLDDDERRVALAKVRERFGRPTTSRTLRVYS